MSKDRFKSITIQQMEAIISLVEERSFSAAARRMLLTQPALTKNIKNAEDYLGKKVVNRGNAGITLTPEGKIIYDYARRIIKLRNEAKEKIIQLAENQGGDIYIGASTIPATYILPYALSAFRKKNHDIRVHIQTADSEETMNMVIDKQVELGIIGKKPLNKKLNAEPLWKDRLVLVVSRNHPWSRKKFITLPDLLKEPFVVREKGSATRESLKASLEKTHSINLAQLNICAEMGSSEAIKEATIAGLGVSVISVHAIARELSRKLLFTIPFPGCDIERNIYLIYPRQLELNLHHKSFVDFLKSYIPSA